MEIAAPLEIHRETVDPEWIDYNGHMNVAYYLMAADHAMGAFGDHIGLGERYTKATNRSTFAVDMRIVYLREFVVDAPIRVTAQLIAFDAKRIHVCLALRHGEEGWISALSEWGWCMSVSAPAVRCRCRKNPGQIELHYGGA